MHHVIAKYHVTTFIRLHGNNGRSTKNSRQGVKSENFKVTCERVKV